MYFVHISPPLLTLISSRSTSCLLPHLCVRLKKYSPILICVVHVFMTAAPSTGAWPHPSRKLTLAPLETTNY